MSQPDRATIQQVMQAVLVMAEVVPFFPQTEGAQAVIATLMREFVGTTEELDWLTKTACKQSRWRGVAELRGIFCTRFAPFDGVEQDATTPGFRPSDIEQEFSRLQGELVAQRLEEWKRDAPAELTLASGPDPEPLKAPKVRDLEYELETGPRRYRSPAETRTILEQLRRDLAGEP